MRFSIILAVMILSYPTLGMAQVQEKGDQKIAKLHWRDDPTVLRHPGSYIAFGIGYNQGRAWFTPTQDEFDEAVSVGPVHGWQTTIRVGDAFFEWLALGFQVDMAGTVQRSTNTVTGFGVLLDVTLYPWRGLGIRPSIGLGFSYAIGDYNYEMGYGGPLDVSLAITYEFRLGKLLVLAPVAQTYWIRADQYDSLFFVFGIEFAKWFATPTG